MRKNTVILVAQEEQSKLIWKYSTLNKLQRVVAYMFRFVHNAKSLSSNRITEPLRPEELRKSLKALIKTAQGETYPKEIARLQNKRSVQSRSKLLSLNPFLDSEGILRVGKRLQQAKFKYRENASYNIAYKTQYD